MQRLYLLLADGILILHTVIVLFNVGALPVICESAAEASTALCRSRPAERES